MDVVWWELHEIWSFPPKKVVSRFVTKHVSTFLEYFSSVKPLVHTKLIIGRLPSFIFLRSFDSMVSVARHKHAVNMADPTISWTYYGKETVALN